MQTSFVYSAPPLAPKYDPQDPNRPFVPFRTDADILNGLTGQRDIEREKLMILRHLQDELPYHHFLFLSFVFACMKIDEEIETIQRALCKDRTFSISKLFAYFDVNREQAVKFKDFAVTM